LAPESLKAQIYVNDWIRADKRTQEQKQYDFNKESVDLTLKDTRTETSEAGTFG